MIVSTRAAAERASYLLGHDFIFLILTEMAAPSWLSSEDGRYVIKSMSAATLPGAFKLLRDSFFPQEAACIGTEVDKDPLAVEECLELCADAALDGLSLVAVDTHTGEVVSTVFSKLQEAPTPGSTEKSFFEIFTEERCKRPASRAMMEFMVELDAKCNYFERYGVDCCWEIMFLGTLPEHRRKGLATMIVKTAVDLAKQYKNGPIFPLTIADLGPDYAFMKPRKPSTKVPKLCTALWSAIGSKKVGQTVGFTVLVDYSFADFIYNGKPCSDRIGSVTTCEGVALKI